MFVNEFPLCLLQDQNLIQSGVLWVLLPGSNPMFVAQCPVVPQSDWTWQCQGLAVVKLVIHHIDHTMSYHDLQKVVIIKIYQDNQQDMGIRKTQLVWLMQIIPQNWRIRRKPLHVTTFDA